MNIKWKEIFATLKQTGGTIGKHVLVDGAILTLLGFKSAQQGIAIGQAWAQNGFAAAMTLAAETKSRISIIAYSTLALAGLSYTTGWPPFFIFASLGLYLFMFYAGLIVFGAVLTYRAVASTVSDRPVAPVEETSGKKRKKPDTPEQSAGKLIGQAFTLTTGFILLNMWSKPWLPGHFEPFAGLFLCELVWFLMVSWTRKLVRTTLVTVTGVTAIIYFGTLVLPYLDQVPATAGTHEKIVNIGADLVNIPATAGEKSLKKLKRLVNSMPELWDYEERLDMNGDDELDQDDASILEQYALTLSFDSTQTRCLTIDDKRYLLGDFDGNGRVNPADAASLRTWLTGCGMPPAELEDCVTVPIVAAQTQQPQAPPPAPSQQPVPPPVQQNTAPPQNNMALANQTASAVQFARYAAMTASEPTQSTATLDGPFVLIGAKDFFKAVVTRIDYLPENVVVTVEFSDPQLDWKTERYIQRPSLGQRTRLVDANGYSYPIEDAEGIALSGNTLLTKGGRVEVKAIFPRPANGVAIQKIEWHTIFGQLFVAKLQA